MARKNQSKPAAQKKKVSVHEAVNLYIEKLNKEVTLDDALKAIMSRVTTRSPFPEELIQQQLASRQDLLLSEEDIFPEQKLVPRRLFFQDALIRIVPTDLEVKEGILFPGHRFVPFTSLSMPPCLIDARYKDKPLEQVRIKQVVEDIMIYHTLLGMPLALGYLGMDNLGIQFDDIPDLDDISDMMLDTMPSMDTEVTLTVIDMKDFYREHGIEGGMPFLAKVKDYDLAVVELMPQPKSATIDFSRAHKWCTSFEKSLKAVFDHMTGPKEIPEQLAYAFFYGGADLIKDPAMHVGGFLSWSKDICIQRFGTMTMLWDAHTNPGEIMSRAAFELGGPMTGSIECLEDILHDIQFAYSESEIEAVILNEFYRGHVELSADDLLKRLLQPGSPPVFYNDEQKEAFYEFLNERIQDLANEYNRFADERNGALRERMLVVLESAIDSLVKLDDEAIPADDYPQDPMLMLAEMRSHINGLLDFMADNINMTKPEYAQTEGAVELIEVTFPRLIEDIRNNLGL